MPLLKSRTKEAKRRNYLELTMGEMSDTRRKAIKTIMKRRRVSFEEARRVQAAAIVRNV